MLNSRSSFSGSILAPAKNAACEHSLRCSRRGRLFVSSVRFNLRHAPVRILAPIETAWALLSGHKATAIVAPHRPLIREDLHVLPTMRATDQLWNGLRIQSRPWAVREHDTRLLSRRPGRPYTVKTWRTLLRTGIFFPTVGSDTGPVLRTRATRGVGEMNPHTCSRRRADLSSDPVRDRTLLRVVFKALLKGAYEGQVPTTLGLYLFRAWDSGTHLHGRSILRMACPAEGNSASITVSRSQSDCERVPLRRRQGPP